MDKLNILAIRSVLLAVELGSLSAAGAQQGVPPSTISRRVKELEAELGRRLLVRSGRGVSPAEEAQDTFRQLRNVLQAVDDCYAPPAEMTSLRVTAPSEMTISLLAGIIPAFHKEFPDVVIYLRGSDQVVGMIEADFDLAIRTGTLEDSNLIRKKLNSGGLVLVAAPKLRKRITSLEALIKAPFIEVIGPPDISGSWKGESFRIRSPVIASLDTFTAAFPALYEGLGYAQMPFYLVQDAIASGRLSVITQVQLTQREIHALYPKRHRNQRAISAFIREVEGSLSSISST